MLLLYNFTIRNVFVKKNKYLPLRNKWKELLLVIFDKILNMYLHLLALFEERGKINLIHNFVLKNIEHFLILLS